MLFNLNVSKKPHNANYDYNGITFKKITKC